MATVDAGTAARELLHVVMLVMRTVAADMRRKPGAVAPAQMGTLMKVSVGPCTMSGLARHQAVSLPTVSKSVDMLVCAAGWNVGSTSTTGVRRWCGSRLRAAESW